MKSLQEREWFFSQEKEPFECTNYDPRYNVYRLKTTRQLICDIEIDAAIGCDPIIIGAVADLHLNVCNNEDRRDEELAYTEQCRMWQANAKAIVPAVKALDAADFCDAAVILGDIMDYLSRGAMELVKLHINKKHPDFMMALGGHDITKQMQTGRPDKLPVEEREEMVKPVWNHDINYYSRTVKDKVLCVVLNNSRSKYLECQIEKLRADIEAARKEGKIIIIFQHEPISTNDPENARVPANIANGGAATEANFCGAGVIGPDAQFDEATEAVYNLIVGNADVIKAVVAGHWHSQFSSEIKASYVKDGTVVDARIPEYAISGNPYHEAGLLARLIIK